MRGRSGRFPGRPHVVRARQRVRGPEGLPPGGEDQPGGWHSRAKIDASRDFYRILQVGPYDGQDAIKAAYRRLLKLHHPDLSSSFDATRRMQEINEAYEVLSDPERRRAHVLLREAYLHPRVPAYPASTASRWASYEAPFDPPPGHVRRPAWRPPRWLVSILDYIFGRVPPRLAMALVVLIVLAVYLALPTDARQAITTGFVMLFPGGIPIVP